MALDRLTGPIGRTHAVMVRRNSYSASSVARYSVQGRLLIRRDPRFPQVQTCAESNWYSLSDLLESESDSARQSEGACKDYLAQILRQTRLNQYKFKVKAKLAGLESLMPLYCSVPHLPDVQVFSSRVPGLPVVVVEVHSSLYGCTIEKCIMSVVEQLRLYRSYDTDITSCTGFAFPKCGTEKQCVVKVQVTWVDLYFSFALTCIRSEDVHQSIRDAVSGQRAPRSLSDQQCEFVVALSPADLTHFGQSAIQIRSTSAILVEERNTQMWYKCPINENEQHVCEKISMTFEGQRTSCVVKYTTEVMCRSVRYVKYKALPHDPLNVTEAYKCLRNLLQELHEAIETYHEYGFAHQDIRLENVCFDANYKPVLIDLDRSLEVYEMPCDNYESSCMYRYRTDIAMSVQQVDWMQLGWLAAWVVHPDPTGSYHSRNFEDLPEDLKTDPFLSTLIERGMW